MKAICLVETDPLFGAFCSSRLAFFLNCEFWMISFRAEVIFASSISKFGKSFPQTDREDFNSSKESTISPSVIHNKASDGKSEQVVSWFLNFIIQHKNVEGVGELVELQFRHLLTLLSNHRILLNIHWRNELTVDGLLAHVGIGIVPLILSSSLAKEVPTLLLVELTLILFVVRKGESVDERDSIMLYIGSPRSFAHLSISFSLLRRPSMVIITLWVACSGETFHKLLMKIVVECSLWVDGAVLGSLPTSGLPVLSSLPAFALQGFRFP